MAKKAKVGKGKKKGKKVPPVKKTLTDIHLPPITDVRCATLQAAVIAEDITSLTRLVAHYDYEKNLTSVEINGSTLIHIAVRKEDDQMLERLLAYRKIDINACESREVGGLSALHIACQTNQRRIVDILLRAGASVNQKAVSTVGETPLMICCKLGRIDCARLLLAAGASVNTVDSYGNNCSFWAYKYQHEAMIRELGLPTVHTATAEEYIQLLLQRNPRFVLPSLKPKAKKKGKDEKGDKKKKK